MNTGTHHRTYSSTLQSRYYSYFCGEDANTHMGPPPTPVDRAVLVQLVQKQHQLRQQHAAKVMQVVALLGGAQPVQILHMQECRDRCTVNLHVRCASWMRMRVCLHAVPQSVLKHANESIMSDGADGTDPGRLD